MKSIIEQLESEIPQGHWCNNGPRETWCPYFQIHKPTLDEKGNIQSWFCDLTEEYVNRKACGINN